jgi:hypothetical protein
MFRAVRGCFTLTVKDFGIVISDVPLETQAWFGNHYFMKYLSICVCSAFVIWGSMNDGLSGLCLK